MITIASDYAIPTDDLTKHLICLGMTGSGKTGMCVRIIEEALKQVPVFILDLKGDVSRMGMDIEVLKKATGATPFLFTPGGTAAIPVNLLASFKAPQEKGEVAQEIAIANVSSLFALLGESPDPLVDTGHILLTKILDMEWSKGHSPTLSDLVHQVLAPPFLQVGAFDLDTFMAPKLRMKLAGKLNGLLASPSLAIWSQGEELDFNRMTAPHNGGQRANIFYLAHLDTNQRQFFVSQFMSRLLMWTRTLSGSDHLRALCFMDEVAGYLPPYPLSPASKKPILTLFKQARGVGLGMMLATQNPVDLDYSSISNAGTWLVGRLQTRQDREKVLAGMDTTTVEESWIATLKPREFVLNSAIKGETKIVRSLDTNTKLGGPVSRNELIQNGKFLRGDCWQHRLLGMESRVGETTAEFLLRVQEQLNSREATKLSVLLATYKSEAKPLVKEHDTVLNALNELSRDQTYKKVGEAVGIAETVFSLLSGRKKSLGGLVSRRSATTKVQNRLLTLTTKKEHIEGRIQDLAKKLEEDKEALIKEKRDLLAQIEEG